MVLHYSLTGCVMSSWVSHWWEYQQDPYHGRGQANGLSFSVPEGIKIPSSLLNIYREIEADIGCSVPSHGNLENWAYQVRTSLTNWDQSLACLYLINLTPTSFFYWVNSVTQTPLLGMQVLFCWGWLWLLFPDSIPDCLCLRSNSTSQISSKFRVEVGLIHGRYMEVHRESSYSTQCSQVIRIPLLIYLFWFHSKGRACGWQRYKVGDVACFCSNGFGDTTSELVRFDACNDTV